MSRFFTLLIRLYQLTLSPIFLGLGSQCRFHPSCSVYAAHAFRRYPWYHAALLTIKRLSKCHPWHPGGIDTL